MRAFPCLVPTLALLWACEPATDDKSPTHTGEADTDTDTDADTDADTDTDTDADTDTDTDTDTGTAVQALEVVGLGSVAIPEGSDYADVTAQGIPPFSYSRHTLTLQNTSGADVTLDGITAAATAGALEDEWRVIDPGVSLPTDLDAAGTVVPAGGSFTFDLYYNPFVSGPCTDEVTITYDGGRTFAFTTSGRGRDALSFFDHGVNTIERYQGDPAADVLQGGAVGDGTGAIWFNGNANGWSDGFSENLALTRMEADGSLGWTREWNEPYEQLSPDPGQNAESGGSADSIDLSAGVVYVAGHRSQSSSNSVFQSFVTAVDAATGDLRWASAWSPDDVAEPQFAWQSSQAYAVDASLSDRVIVAGSSFGNAEVLLYALSKADGSLLWSRQIDVAAGYNDRAHALAVDGDGNAFLGGITNGRGLLLRVTGVDGAAPQLDWALRVDMGTGSNLNSLDVDASGDVYASLDRRGATTQLSVAKFTAAGALAWAKTWDDGNANDNNNSHVVRLDDAGHVYLGGRVAVATLDTQFGEAFLARLDAATGAYDWGALYYTGKGAEEIVEHRVKGVTVDGAGDLRLLVQSYAVSLNFDHAWGFWYDLADDPLADLTLGEDPGDGAALLVDYAPSVTDVTATTDLHVVDGAYNGTNVAWVQLVDGSAIWQAPPATVAWGDLRDWTGAAPEGDAALMVLDLF